MLQGPLAATAEELSTLAMSLSLIRGKMNRILDCPGQQRKPGSPELICSLTANFASCTWHQVLAQTLGVLRRAVTLSDPGWGGSSHSYNREETPSVLLMLSPRTAEILVSYCRWVNQSVKTPALQAKSCQAIYRI